ncbi:MAG: histidinol-phosphatase [Ruminococcus sp.]|nr:histidinol-phosphatase [Ruminococcus sp.]
MIYNLHTHTVRCNHAVGEDREYVENAIKAGISVLGFSDHCPQFFPDTDYYSYFRMRPELAEDYVNSVRQLQKEYASDIKILLGFETEYYPKTYRRFMEFIKPLELDYLIMGQHFIGNEYDQNSYYSAYENRDELFVKRYVDQVIEGIDKGVFTYIAHPDIVNYKGNVDYYNKQMAKLCKYAKKLKIPLEYNILGYVNKKCYPNPLFWKIASEVGNRVVLGFDAHNPKALLRMDIYEECQNELALYGIEPVDFKDVIIRNPIDKNV